MLFYRILSIHYKSILFSLLIVFLSLYPFESNQASGFFDFPHSDKVIHFMLYGFLAFIIFTEIPGNMDIKKYTTIILICLLVGGLIELIQVFIENRSGDIYDLMANLGGSLFAVPAHKVFEKVK